MLAALLLLNVLDLSPGRRFVEVGTHPGAAAQPTPRGRMIVNLTAWSGRLYAGYGDINENTGPIAVMPYDPALDAFVPEWVSDTEAIYLYRRIGGRLYAPATDRKFDADYAASAPWSDVHVVGTSHAFDMARLTGGDLWLVGSLGVDAVAWRSRDLGLTWDEALRVAPAPGYTFARFYFAGIYRRRLYLQASPGFSMSRVFDGQQWSAGPDLLALGGTGWHPVVMAGRMLYQSGTPYVGGSQLLSFDGAEVTALLPFAIHDFVVTPAGLFTLAMDGAVHCSPDLVRWTLLARAPTVAQSVGWLDGVVYVGTTDSRLLRLEDAVELCPVVNTPSGTS